MPTPTRRVPWAAPPVIGLLAATIAGYRVGRPAIWRDEVATITAASRSWAALGGTVAHVDAVHALFYTAMHVWFDVVPYTPFTLRLPSVLATGGTAAAVTVLGTRLAGLRAGVLAGVAAAVLPSLVWAGGEGRSYAWTALLATLTTLAFVHALGAHASRRRAVLAWAGAAALLALGTALFIDTLLLGAAQVVTAALLARDRRILAAAAAVAGAAAVNAPLLLLAVRQTGQVAWIARFGVPSPWTEVVVLQWFGTAAIAIAWVAVIALALAVSLLRRRPPTPVLAVALPWAVLPPVLLLAVGLVHEPIYWPRYVTFTAPAVALLVGAALAATPLPVAVAGVLVLGVVAVPQIRADRKPRAKADSEMQLAAQLVQRERRASDGAAGIIYGQYDDVVGLTTRGEAIAYPGAFRGLRDLTLRVPLDRGTSLFGTELPTDDAVERTTGLRTVWILLDLDSDPKTHVPAAGLRAAGFRETGRFRTSGSLLLRWTRR